MILYAGPQWMVRLALEYFIGAKRPRFQSKTISKMVGERNQRRMWIGAGL
jgi:hypothetical protein